ncbi:hypothetical protein ZIOFF_017246 [Zingiber officinale]|uniref:Uncharacterized protein n=1 Tax=Zingiber officinale TaxID=94328 RepID=A0A8J5HEH8_ZINOF|nr:hypothetical protein ZIOFF_017246 [Zingiber officinale]
MIHSSFTSTPGVSHPHVTHSLLSSDRQVDGRDQSTVVSLFELDDSVEGAATVSPGRTMAHHQLGNGMLVSGPPPTPPRGRETSSSCTSPYTSGDAKNSGEFAKMFGIPSVEYSVSAAGSRSAHPSGSKRTPHPPSPIPTTGLIISGDSSRRRARQGGAVTVVEGKTFEYGVPRACMWLVAAVLSVGLGLGGILLGVAGRPELLAAVAAASALVGAVAIWNRAMGAKEVERSIRSLPDYPFNGPTDLPIGQLVKITGASSLLFQALLLRHDFLSLALIIS